MYLHALPQPLVCVGIDLAGVPHRDTGIAVLRDGHLDELTTAHEDEEILAFAERVGRHGLVAVNAPLSLPRGRCCLDDDCRCRHDPGTRSRAIERELLRQRVPILATGLIKVLARRGVKLAVALRLFGYAPLEVYPFATLRLLGLPTAGKRTQLGRRRIHQALQEIVPGLAHPEATEHELDAIVCAYTAQLWHFGQARTVGDPTEGLMIVPSLPAPAVTAADRAAARLVAETPAHYSVD